MLGQTDAVVHHTGIVDCYGPVGGPEVLLDAHGGGEPAVGSRRWGAGGLQTEPEFALRLTPWIEPGDLTAARAVAC